MNGDKLSTLHYMFTLSMQHGKTNAAQRNDINYLGSYAGAMMQSPSDSSPDEALPGDVETAKLFGKRVAEVTRQFVAGRVK